MPSLTPARAPSAPLSHLDTFARLHIADTGDIDALTTFSFGIRSRRHLDRSSWQRLVLAADAKVLVATECQLIVGVAILRHAHDTGGARLGWLAVTPDAQNRGVGRLLLGATIDEARAEGAVDLRAMVPEDALSIVPLLQSAGFLRDGSLPDWRLSLWHGQSPRKSPQRGERS